MFTLNSCLSTLYELNFFSHRDHEEKVEAMRIFSDHVLPGRWDDARLPNPSEIKGTKVISS